jgi:3'(2'), 5'-bisphosphate nucleotidase
MDKFLQLDINEIIAIAQKEGDVIMEIYAKDFTVEYKDDKSPLTEADQKANEIIVNGLNALSLKFPILSEEGKMIPYEERKDWEYFWMVDPLDGTKEFIKKK